MPLGSRPGFRSPIPRFKPGVLRFDLGDCLEVLRSLTPGTVSVIVTSPPYNLGARSRSYDDTLPRDRCLDRTGAWIKAAAKAGGPHGARPPRDPGEVPGHVQRRPLR